MAETSREDPGAAVSDPEGIEARALENLERRWRIRVARADLFQKILISIVGACIAAVFYIYQANQTQSRYYSDLQSQRERADADLRAKMFDTLFQAYFKNKIEAAPKVGAGGLDTCTNAATLLQNLGREITLSDLLARNFETVDVRPLFEDIDKRLTGFLADCRHGTRPSSRETLAFHELEQLRRAAYGATSRQTESLQANARAEVKEVRIEQWQSGVASTPKFVPDRLPFLPDDVLGIIRRVDDGSVAIELTLLASDAAPPTTQGSEIPLHEASPTRSVPITVTYYDMPALEHVRLPDGRRLALSLTRSRSTLSCERFRSEMDESARLDCDQLIQSGKAEGSLNHRAVLRLTLIPKTYIGPRDRPYLSDLSSRGSSGWGLDRFKLPWPAE
jgi:hypothetical protein